MRLLYCLLLVAAAVRADEPLPEAKAVPVMQAVPLPAHGVSFQFRGRELTRLNFAEGGQKPFLFPVNGPGGVSLTRMGHPHDAVSHGHHTSVWVGINDVAKTNFWEQAKTGISGRVELVGVDRYWDGDAWCGTSFRTRWLDGTGKVLLQEQRTISVRKPDAVNAWLLLLDLAFTNPASEPVVIGETAFGPLGVRMAKTIGVVDGGGRILNSVGQRNEADVFRKPARWVDYSGPISPEVRGGIALLDHPDNLHHPVAFHVRNDGWMGASPFFAGAVTLGKGEVLPLRYGLWMHGGVPEAATVDAVWKEFSDLRGLVPGDSGKK